MFLLPQISGLESRELKIVPDVAFLELAPLIVFVEFAVAVILILKS